MMQELFKQLISPIEVSDELASYYISIGKQLIENYINNEDIDVEYLYANQIVQTSIWLFGIAQQSKATVENGGIQSLSSSGRSVSWFGMNDLSNLELPSHIKEQLPHYVKCW